MKGIIYIINVYKQYHSPSHPPKQDHGGMEQWHKQSKLNSKLDDSRAEAGTARGQNKT